MLILKVKVMKLLAVIIAFIINFEVYAKLTEKSYYSKIYEDSKIISFLKEIKKTHDLNKQIKTIPDKSGVSSLKKKLHSLNSKLIIEIEKFPSKKIGLLFLAIVNPDKNEQYEIDFDVLDAGVATVILQKKSNFISINDLRNGYQFILPELNVHKLKNKSPINNLLLYQILKDKNLLSKLTPLQIEKTFISSAYSKSSTDERIDYAIQMLNTNFDLIDRNCNLTKVLLDLHKDILINTNPITNDNYRYHLYDLLIKKFTENKKNNSNLLLYLNFNGNNYEIFNFLDISNIQSKDVQDFFDISLDLNENYKISDFSFHRNSELQLPNKELALAIYKLKKSSLREEQIIKAYLKAIHLKKNKKLLFPELAEQIFNNSKEYFKKNPILIERTLIHASQFNSNFLFSNKKLLDETISFITREKIQLNFETIENIYLKITKNLNKNRNEFLYIAQNLLNYLFILNEFKASNLEAYY